MPKSEVVKKLLDALSRPEVVHHLQSPKSILVTVWGVGGSSTHLCSAHTRCGHYPVMVGARGKPVNTTVGVSGVGGGGSDVESVGGSGVVGGLLFG